MTKLCLGAKVNIALPTCGFMGINWVGFVQPLSLKVIQELLKFFGLHILFTQQAIRSSLMVAIIRHETMKGWNAAHQNDQRR